MCKKHGSKANVAVPATDGDVVAMAAATAAPEVVSAVSFVDTASAPGSASAAASAFSSVSAEAVSARAVAARAVAYDMPADSKSGRAMSPNGSDSGADDQLATFPDELVAVNALQTLQHNANDENEDDFGVTGFPFTEPIGFRRIFSSDRDVDISTTTDGTGSNGIGGVGGATMQLMPAPAGGHGSLLLSPTDDDDGIGKFPFNEPIGFRRIFSVSGDDDTNFTDGGLGPLAILATIAWGAAGM